MISLFTNQFFLLFVAVTTGMLLGKIKIGNFSLGVSGGIFSGIAIGYFVTLWANQQQKGAESYSKAAGILKSGVIAQPFFTFFLLLFLVAIGLRVGKNMGVIFRKYGVKFVIIGAVIPLVSMLMTVFFLNTVYRGNKGISDYETIGMYAGAMTSTPAYGTALDAASSVNVASLYQNGSEQTREDILSKIDPALKSSEVDQLTEEQVAGYRKTAEAGISLGYTVAFPFGVLVIVIMISILPRIFGIEVKKEAEDFQKEMVKEGNTSNLPDKKLDFASIGIVVLIGFLIGSINIPLGILGKFSLGTAGGVLLSALVLSHIGKVGPISFRMEDKALGVLSQMGLTFFMAVVGLRYGFDVISALTGSGLVLALTAIGVEAVAVLVAFIIGRKCFKLNWVLLSGAICGGCTSAPGLGAAISSLGSDEPSTGYGAAQPFAILANVLLTTIFFALAL